MDDAWTTSSPGHDGELQRLVDALFDGSATATQLELLVRADSFDLDEELREVVSLLPPGAYDRARMCDQLNSIITAHGWGMTVGTVS